MRNTDEVFKELQHCKFRSSFRLGRKESEYLTRKGLEKVIEEGRAFVKKRLCPARPKNDGKQTPMKNHPFFTAQHATGTCCRGCLSKWHKIPKGIPLNEQQISYILNITGLWLKKQLAGSKPGQSVVRQEQWF